MLPFFKPKKGFQLAGSGGGGGGGSIDTSAVANKTDLTAIILTGTTNTSGNVISAGTWFYLNGKPCISKVDIASGATFTEGTNYEEKTIGSALTELNSKIDNKQNRLPCYVEVELDVGDNVIHEINVNAGHKGRTILVLISQQWDAGDGTGSEIGILRCGYNGGNVTYIPIGGSQKAGYEVTFSCDSSGTLIIHQNLAAASYVMMFANR